MADNIMSFHFHDNNQIALSVHHFGGYSKTSYIRMQYSFRITCDMSVEIEPAVIRE